MIRHRLLAGTALACLSLPTRGFAQAINPIPADIVVTATRSARALADVPASVSVVTADQIADTPASTIHDFPTYRDLDPATLPAGCDIGARLINAGTARRRGVVQVENLFDCRYVGTNDDFTAPLYGKPLTAVAGVRLKLG